MSKTYKRPLTNYQNKNRISRLKDRKQIKYSYKEKDVKNGSSYKKYWFWNDEIKACGKHYNIRFITKINKKFNYLKKSLLEFENQGKSRKEYDI